MLVNPAELHDFLRSRHSMRRFQPRDVEPDALTRILETATHAPSAHNRQPWRFAVLTTPASKSDLAEAMAADFARDLVADQLSPSEISQRVERSQTRIKEAPVVIILCMDESEMDKYPDARRQHAETMMAIQSTSLAGLQLLLAVHAEGLSGVWVCAPLFAPGAVRNALSLPETWQPQSMFFIGHPAGTPAQRDRKPFDTVIVRR
jgi:coenzyme F420-0:L-glutamate ligase/coenzyme F420-1:gamma-L-glutamate ligase